MVTILAQAWLPNCLLPTGKHYKIIQLLTTPSLTTFPQLKIKLQLSGNVGQSELCALLAFLVLFITQLFRVTKWVWVIILLRRSVFVEYFC